MEDETAIIFFMTLVYNILFKSVLYGLKDGGIYLILKLSRSELRIETDLEGDET